MLFFIVDNVVAGPSLETPALEERLGF